MVAAELPGRTEIVRFEARHLGAVAKFSERVWDRPRTPGYLRWRYLDHPAHQAYLALRGSECLAMVSCFCRPYQAGDRLVEVADAFDWYSLPELRGGGAGVRVMQRLMQDSRPVVVTGGTADTRDLLPRMHFQTSATVTRFALLLDAMRAGEALARRVRIPAGVGRLAFTAARALLTPRVRAKPARAQVELPTTVGEEVLAIDPRPAGVGTAPGWTSDYLAWLAAASPSLGKYVPMVFRVGGDSIGWALLRVYDGEQGRVAAVVDVRAVAPDPGVYTWMLSEVAVHAMAFRPDLLTASTSCEHVAAALRANRLRPIATAPVHCWARAEGVIEQPLVMGAHWGDETILPYPRDWSES